MTVIFIYIIYIIIIIILIMGQLKFYYKYILMTIHHDINYRI